MLQPIKIVMKVFRNLFPAKYSCVFLLFFGFILVFTAPSYAQGKLNVNRLNPQETFDFLLEFAVKNEFFIMNMDSKSYWLQVKSMVDKKTLFKKTRKYRINFLVTPSRSKGSTITIQMSEEGVSASLDHGSTYEDDGIVREGKYHELLMEKLNTFFAEFKQ